MGEKSWRVLTEADTRGERISRSLACLRGDSSMPGQREDSNRVWKHCTGLSYLVVVVMTSPKEEVLSTSSEWLPSYANFVGCDWKNLSPQKYPDFWDRTSMTGWRDRSGKEADRIPNTLKEFSSYCLTQDFSRKSPTSLWQYPTRGSPYQTLGTLNPRVLGVT